MIRLEAAFLAMVTLYTYGVRETTFTPRRPWRGGGGRGYFAMGSSRSVRSRPTNPNGPDGKPIFCLSRGSFRHLMAE